MKHKLISLIFAGGLLVGCEQCPPNPPVIPSIPSVPLVEEIIGEEEKEEIIEEYEEPLEDDEIIPDPEPKPEPRDDFYVNMIFDEYKVGDNFLCSGRVQNKDISNIIISNETGGLEWSLLKGDEIIKTDTIKGAYSITLKDQGYVELEQLLDEIKLTTENTIIDYDGKTVELPFPISLKYDNISHTFTESGEYSMEFVINYLLGDEIYQSKYKSDFEVEEWKK